MTRWPGGPPRPVPRPRSPLAHGPSTSCSSCADCTSCDAGRRWPRHYRVTATRDPRLPLYVCTGCDGRLVTCLNLAPDLEGIAPC